MVSEVDPHRHCSADPWICVHHDFWYDETEHYGIDLTDLLGIYLDSDSTEDLFASKINWYLLPVCLDVSMPY
jgi:hypothetical protein